MTKNTQTRTLVGLVMLLLALGVNTFLEVANFYNEWIAWTVAALAFLIFVIMVRIQQRATTAQFSILFSTPFVLMALGVLVWTAIG
jgi:uncharacterized integral membrane protein